MFCQLRVFCTGEGGLTKSGIIHVMELTISSSIYETIQPLCIGNIKLVSRVRKFHLKSGGAVFETSSLWPSSLYIAIKLCSVVLGINICQF